MLVEAGPAFLECRALDIFVASELVEAVYRRMAQPPSPAHVLLSTSAFVPPSIHLVYVPVTAAVREWWDQGPGRATNDDGFLSCVEVGRPWRDGKHTEVVCVTGRSYNGISTRRLAELMVPIGEDFVEWLKNAT